MKGQTSSFAKNIAGELRKNMTDAEKKLWRHIRAAQLGVKFRRQHPFENYVLDFVCLDKKLVLEIDGSQHGENVEKDLVRTIALEKAGFKVLRFWNNEMLLETEAVLEKIMGALGQALEGEGNALR